MIGCHRSPLASNGLSSKLAAAKPLLGKAVYCIDNVGVNIAECELEDYVKSLSIRVISSISQPTSHLQAKTRKYLSS